MTEQTHPDRCYFCTETDRLHKHHIVPRRFNGSDESENLVAVCPTCHSKLENLYDKRFYDALGVDKETGRQMPNCDYCDNPADGQWCNWRMMDSSYLCYPCADKRGRSLEVKINTREDSPNTTKHNNIEQPR